MYILLLREVEMKILLSLATILIWVGVSFSQPIPGSPIGGGGGSGSCTGNLCTTTAGAGGLTLVGLSAPTRGDILSGQGASPAWAALAKGAQYSVLVMGANEPAWLATSANVNTLLGSATFAAFRTSLGLGAGAIGSIPTGTTGDIYSATDSGAESLSVKTAAGWSVVWSYAADNAKAGGWYNTTSNPTCNAGTKGLIASVGSTPALQICDGSNWITLVAPGGALGTDATMTTPKITTNIKDQNGYPIIGFTPYAAARSYLGVGNAAAGNGDIVFIDTVSSQSAATLQIDAKGVGLVNIAGVSNGGATIGAGGGGVNIFGATYPSYSTTSYTSTQNINIDGLTYTDYTYGPGTGTAGAYTTVITSGPSSGVRYITMTLVGGTNGITTITWTNVTAIGAALATSVTATKKSTYVCVIEASSARCKAVAENY
jgi:hypothetical protein